MKIRLRARVEVEVPRLHPDLIRNAVAELRRTLECEGYATPEIDFCGRVGSALDRATTEEK